MNPEALAYWYLRLNGFLTLQNHVVHPDRWREGQRTDIDVLGVRFPFHRELLIASMADDVRFTKWARTVIVLGEAKTTRCELNMSWRDKQNIERIVRIVGAFPDDRVNGVVAHLCTKGSYDNANLRVVIMAFGSQADAALQQELPELEQVMWPDICSFIHHRFLSHEKQKRPHPQWDQTGHRLWDLFETHRYDRDAFANAVVGAFHRSAAP